MVRAVKTEENQTDHFFFLQEKGTLIHLDPEMQRELLAIVPAGLFVDTLGYTPMVEHNIGLENPSPVRQKMCTGSQSDYSQH